jgi:hypothetical protein
VLGKEDHKRLGSILIHGSVYTNAG